MLTVTKKKSLNNLLLEAQKGSNDSFSIAIEEITPRLRSFLLRRGVPYEDVDDVLQETFINVFNNIGRFNPKKGNAFTWCCTIASRKLIDNFRRNNRKRKITIVDSDVVELKGCKPEERDERLETIVKALEFLPQEHKDVVSLHYGRGITIKQTAKMLGIPDGTVKSRANRAIKLFRNIFATSN